MAAAEGSSSARSGGGGATAESYIGSLISLTSKSEIRYEGILYNINTDESSIGLRNVRSFGTEGRKKDGPQVQPSDKIYEYILFRGSDIKDLQVKSSPPVQPTPPINSDPAIIQSHYSRPTTSSTNLPTNVSGSLTDFSSQSAQPGHPGSTFQSSLPLYQPGGNLGSWGPSPPPQNANGSGLPMPMYWQNFYGAPNGMPQMHQQSMLRPPTGLLMPPSMQQMQFSGFNPSMPPAPSNLPEYPSSLALSTTNSLNLAPPSLPASTLSSTVPPMQPMSLASETLANMVSSKPPVSGIPTSTLSAPLPSISPLTTPGPDLNTSMAPIPGKPNAISGAALSHQTTSQHVTSVAGTFSSVRAEAPTPSLVTPGQLLQSGAATGPSAVSSIQSSQVAQKDVEVVQVSPNPSPAPAPAPAAPVRPEAQPPILPLPQSARVQRPYGAPFQTRQNYRGRGGRGTMMSRPTPTFTEEFDFMAMNEKFKKEEVWGSLGRSNKSKDIEGNDSDDYDAHVEDDTELDKAVYNKDDFFDNLSSNAGGHDSNQGRMRFSEQMKLDTETFGDFPRYRGGRGGRGPGRGGRSRGSYQGRGGGYGYGYNGRGGGGGGRGRGVSYQSSS